MNIKKGDTVIVTTGKDKGKKAKVLSAFPRENKVLVEGVNMQKKHERARKAGQKGQVISRAMPLNVSNVMIVDPKTGKGTRVGYKMIGDKKVRVAVGSGTEL